MQLQLILVQLLVTIIYIYACTYTNYQVQVIPAKATKILRTLSIMLALFSMLLLTYNVHENASIIQQSLHIMSQKHISGKKKLALASKEESRIQKALHVYDSRTQLVGDGLPDSTQVYRVKVVIAMLKAGVPLSKVDLFETCLKNMVMPLRAQLISGN